METVTIIEMKHGMLHLEQTIQKENQPRKRRTTSNQEKIKNFISHFTEDSFRFSIKGILNDKLKITHPTLGEIIIKDYRTLLELEPFQPLNERIHRRIISLQRKKIKINKRRIKALGAAIMLTIAIPTTVHFLNQEQEAIAQPIQTETQATLPQLEDLLKQKIIEETKELKQKIYSLDYRLTQTISPTILQLPSITFTIGNNVETEQMREFIESETGKLYIKYANMYGVDPYLLIAKDKQESGLNHEACCPGGYFYNNAGVGISQIERPNNNKEVSAYNYETGQTDTLVLNMENMCNIEKNIQAGAMVFQNCLHKYNNNILIAIQAYNYGPGMMDSILTKYAENTNQEKQDIINNICDTGWLPYIEDAHNNPTNYIKSWGENTYGDDKYLSKVISNYIGQYSINKTKTGETQLLDWFHFKIETIQMEEAPIKSM